MEYSQNLCHQYAHIVKGKPKFEQGVCSVEIGRKFHLTIQGRLSRSALPAGITYESLDVQGNALNLAEVAVLQEELPLFIDALTKNGLIVSAIHNHWIFTNPNILYVHAQSVEHPLSFARKFEDAFKVLKS